MQKKSGYEFILLLAEQLEKIQDVSTSGRIRMMISLVHHIYIQGRTIIPLLENEKEKQDTLKELLMKTRTIVNIYKYICVYIYIMII